MLPIIAGYWEFIKLLTLYSVMQTRQLYLPAGIIYFIYIMY